MACHVFPYVRTNALLCNNLFDPLLTKTTDFASLRLSLFESKPTKPGIYGVADMALTKLFGFMQLMLIL